MSVRERVRRIRSRYAFDDMARALVQAADDDWFDLSEERRDGYRELARHLADEVENIREHLHNVLAEIESDDDEREFLIDVLLDVVLMLDDIDWDAGYRHPREAE